MRSTSGRMSDTGAASCSELPFTDALGLVAEVTVKSTMPRPLFAGAKPAMNGAVMLLTTKLSPQQKIAHCLAFCTGGCQQDMHQLAGACC